MRAIERDARRVIEMWRAIEMFDPPSIPRRPRPSDIRDRKAGSEYVQDIDLTDARELPRLPWQPGHAVAREEPRGGKYGAEWRHTIYGGVFAHETIRDAIVSHFGARPDEDFGGTRKRGETALFAIVVDESGKILPETAAFSTCAWATGRAFSPGPTRRDWLDGFEDVEKQCVRAIGLLTGEAITYTQDDGTQPESTRRWRKLIKEILGEAAEGAILGLINGLTAMAGGVVAGAVTGAAKPIISAAKRKFARDAESGEGAQDADEQGEEPDEPIRGLEVPDLVGFAAHIAALCGVDHLIDARRLRLRIKSEPVSKNKEHKLPEPEKPFLNSFYIEDLTRVINAAPDGYGDALATYMTPPEIVRTRLAPERIDVREEVDRTLWEVRPETFPPGRWPSDVDKPLVFSQQFAVNRIVSGLMDRRGIFSVNGPPGTGKTTLLRDLIADIIVARAEAMAALEHPRDAFPRTNKITWESGDREQWVCAPLIDLTGFEIVVASSNNAAVENITAELPALGAIGKEWREQASYFVEQASALFGTAAWGAIAAPLGKGDNRRQFRDQFWWDYQPRGQEPFTGMFSLLKSLKNGGSLADPPAAERFPTGSGRPRPVRDGAPGVRDWAAAVERFNAARKRSVELYNARDRQCRVTRYPNDEHVDMPDHARELSQPWGDPEWNRARSDLFLAALELHRAFIVSMNWAFRTNISQLFNVMRNASDGPPPEAAWAAWQTLFLMVPVVSTTFASCGRLFAQLGPETLGWLLIDEAGQATPQAPVGALWRATRAVIVGDPLQLEPIVQLPSQVQGILRDCYGVSPGWLPGDISAQGIADRVNLWGTEVERWTPEGTLEQLWVGAPLRVHRRCENPMFAISNKIAYDGLMVYGTKDEQLLTDEVQARVGGEYPGSGWVHVTGGGREGKWSSAEGEALIAVLNKLHRRCEVPLANIRVLSPFVDVVRNCKRRVRGENWEAAPPRGAGDYREQVSRFIDDQIGTVHTMQGQEAEVVIIVLGASGPAHKGAREWACGTPNLLNVAVSRAKRRLYVIGDHGLWSGLPYFRVLADELGEPVDWPGQSGFAVNR